MRKRRKKSKWKRIREKPIVRFLKWYRRKHICEYLCDNCAKPHVVKPDGIELEQFVSGSSVARVFVEQGFYKANYHVEFTCLRAEHDRIVQVPLFRQEHMRDVAKVAALASRFISQQKAGAMKRQKPRRRHSSKG